MNSILTSIKQLVGRYFSGGTTVAGTMILAHLAGIKVFATGGLGGVHRGAESSMDISADLTELGRTPVAVISSGCKSFLDVPRTLEYLETQGVSVATFADGRGKNVNFPSFWSRESGVASPMTVQDEREAAAIIYAQRLLRLSSGLLFGSPIPRLHEIPNEEIDAAIEDALEQARVAGASGKDNTPFILSKIWDITKGRSLEANRALIEMNVIRATKVATHLAELENGMPGEGFTQDVRERSTMTGSVASTYAPDGVSISLAHQDATLSVTDVHLTQTRSTSRLMDRDTSFPPADIVVAGAIAMDYACDYMPLRGSSSPVYPEPLTSNPARINQSVGGVARNIAVAAHYLGSQVLFCGARGEDAAGNAVASDLVSHGLSTVGMKRPGDMVGIPESIENEQRKACHEKLANANTAQYVAINDANKALRIAAADMSILERIDPGLITRQWIEQIQKNTKPKWLVLDTNWASEGLSTWLEAAQSTGAKVAVDPVSVPKSVRIVSCEAIGFKTNAVFPHHKLHLLAPNRLELAAIYEAARSNGVLETAQWWEVIDSLGIPASGARVTYESVAGKALVDQGIPQMSAQLLPLCPCVAVKLGEEGVFVTELLHTEDRRLASAEEAKWIVSRNRGAGPVGGVHMRLFTTTKVPPDRIESVNGVGDTFLATLVAGLAKKDTNVQELVDIAQRASRLTLQSRESVSKRLAELQHEL
ncbi:MAG: hypothetical protein M1822_005452 [Bathelium mastoideum]|nr:MAG: hypothetical protein M1822_005452 [Bathelium mastoideum]